MLQTFKQQSSCWGVFMGGALCRSHSCSPSVNFWSFSCESLCALSSTLKWCVCLWSGSASVCVSVEEDGRPQWTKPQPLSTYLRGVLQPSPFILSHHWLDEVEDLRLQSEEKSSALFWVRKYTRELRKWNSPTPEYTMASLCKLIGTHLPLLPHSSSSPFLSSHLFMSSSPWVTVATPTLQPLQNINAVLMPSLSDSPESWWKGENRRDGAEGRSRCW